MIILKKKNETKQGPKLQSQLLLLHLTAPWWMQVLMFAQFLMYYVKKGRIKTISASP